MTLITIDLDERERELLIEGINQWGGPASCTDELALAMGFAGRKDLFENHYVRLREAVHAGEPLSPFDWTRIQLLTEIVFSSDVFGAGYEWSIVTDFQDEETVQLLRRLQKKILKATAPRKQLFGPGSHAEYVRPSSVHSAIRLCRSGRIELDDLIALAEATATSYEQSAIEVKRLAADLRQAQALDDEERDAAVSTLLDGGVSLAGDFPDYQTQLVEHRQ